MVHPHLGAMHHKLRLVVGVEGIVSVPHVTGIEEDGAMQASNDVSAILQVHNEFQVAILHHIRVGFVRQSGEVAWSDATHGEGSDAVGTTSIEHL